MIRKMLVGVGVILAIGALLLGYAAYNANRLAQRFKPEIERRATEALGAPVQLGRMHVAVFPTLRVAVDTVTIGGDGGVTVARLNLHLRVLPLLRGGLDVARLGVERPAVTIVRDTDGVTIVGLPRRTEPPRTEPPREGGTRPAATGATGAGALALALRELTVREGTVRFEDRQSKRNYTIARLTADASLDLDAERVRVPRFTGSGTVEDRVRFGLRGTDLTYHEPSGRAVIPRVEVDLDGSALRVDGAIDTRTRSGEIHLVSDGVELSTLGPLLALVAPTAAALGLRGTVKPDLHARLTGDGSQGAGTVVLDGVALETDGVSVSGLRGQLDVATASGVTTLRSAGLECALGGQPLKTGFVAEARPDAIDLKEATAEGFGGTASVTGALAGRRVTVDVRAEKLDIAPLLAALRPAAPRTLSGRVARFHAELAGAIGDRFAQSLRGPGSLVVEDGRLIGVNLLGLVLKAVRAVPLVGDAIERALPGAVRETLGGSDTPITRLETTFTVADAALQLSRLEILNPTFTVDGDGRVGFDSSLKLDTTFRFTEDVSRGLVGKVRELSAILDAGGRVALPVLITGKPPAVAVVPNPAKLVTGAAQDLGRKAEQLLRGLFRGSGSREQK